MLKLREKDVRDEIEKLNSENDMLYDKIQESKKWEAPLSNDIDQI